MVSILIYIFHAVSDIYHSHKVAAAISGLFLYDRLLLTDRLPSRAGYFSICRIATTPARSEGKGESLRIDVSYPCLNEPSERFYGVWIAQYRAKSHPVILFFG